MRVERTELRVRYPEVDRMDFAHHAGYLVWFELGRTEILRSAGASYRECEENGYLFPVIEVGCHYHKPAFYDDELAVLTHISVLDRLRTRFEYRIVRGADDDLLAEGFTLHVAMGPNRRPRRMSKDMLDRLEPWVER